MDLASQVLNPTISVIQNVSNYYIEVIYKKLLAKRNHQRYYKLLMDKAKSYEQWAAAGYMLDRWQDNDQWKNQEMSLDYDYELIRDRLNTLRTIRKNGDIPAMIFNLRTSLSRNLGDMGNPKLYESTHVGTKALIEDYIDEVTKQLTFICDADIYGFTIHDKLEFFRNTQIAFGRTGLLLSGGGTFGLAHIGVLKALDEQKLLPRVITGSSAGSIVAGIFATKTDKEIQLILDSRNISLDFFRRKGEKESILQVIDLFMKQGVIRDSKTFEECMINNIGDMTFAEAYNRSRRVLNITVSSSTNYEMPRLLNYLTAPNVLIRSAIAASSAVPFVFQAAPLLAKDANKNIVPWNPSGHLWVDGSMEGDLPMQRIRELFGVNHHLVAQANPHIIPFLNSSARKSRKVSSLVTSMGLTVSQEFQHRLEQMIEWGYRKTFLIKLQSMLGQTYVGDITIIPYFPLSFYGLILANPTIDMSKDYSFLGERATWPRIAILRNHCLIEQCISQSITSLRERLVFAHAEHLLSSPVYVNIPSAPRNQTHPNLGLLNEERGRSSTTTPVITKNTPRVGVNFHFGPESADSSRSPITLPILQEDPSELFLSSQVSQVKSSPLTRNYKSTGDFRTVRITTPAPRKEMQAETAEVNLTPSVVYNVATARPASKLNSKPTKSVDYEDSAGALDLTFTDSDESESD